MKGWMDEWMDEWMKSSSYVELVGFVHDIS